MIMSLLLAVALSAGSQEFEATAVEGAAGIARAKLVEDALSKPPLSGELFRSISADPGRHRDRAGSEKLCREIYRRKIAEDFKAKAAEAASRLSVASLGGDISEAETEKILSRHFAGRFSAERAEAVAQQAKTIAGAIKPAETEFESKDDKTLIREMTAKVVSQQRKAVFEENLKYISETIVKPVVEDGRREMKRQREYLMRTRCEAYAPSAMERELLANLQRNVAERKGKAANGAVAWGVFPGVSKTALAAAVERRVIDRVARGVDDVKLQIDTNSVLKVISDDPSGHLKAADSERVFRGIYAAALLNGATALSESEAPEKEKKEFAEYVRAHLSAPALTRAVETRLRREVLPKWRKARAEAAKAEADRIWPTLADRSWCPDAALADRIASRSDYAAAVASWRKEPELKALVDAADSSKMMEETMRTADRAIVAAFDLSRSAIAAQNSIIGEVEPAVLSEAKDRKSSFWSRTPDLNAIVNMLTQAVEEKWASTRLKTLWGESEYPPNAEQQHVELFPSVKKRIELVARSIFEQMQKPEIVPEKKPQPQEPQDPVESDDTSEKEPEKLEYSIVVERLGGEIKVRLEQGKETLIERGAKENMRDFLDAVKAVSAILGGDILKLK